MSQSRRSFFSRYRRLIAWGVLTALVGVGCLWLLADTIFQFRFGAFLPSGATGSTQVRFVSWQAPRDARPSYSLQICQYFGWYYPEFGMRWRWWDRFPKALSDVLDEWGAQVRDGKLRDASGRPMVII